MSLYTDLEAARQTWLREQAQADAAKAAYDALVAQQLPDGPDLSQFQTTVDFAQLATKAGFAFTRVADGDVRDLTYAARVAGLRGAGIPYAPYYFARVSAPGNNERNGRLEAAMSIYFAATAGWGKTGDLPLAYDFETLNGQTEAKAGKHLIQYVKTYQWVMQHLPIIYTNPSTVNAVVPTLDAGEQALLAQCPLWVAHWGVSAPTIPPPWTSWTFWQYTNAGTIAGVTGSLDLNHFAGSRSDLDALRIP